MIPRKRQDFADQRENAGADRDADAVKDQPWQGERAAELRRPMGGMIAHAS